MSFPRHSGKITRLYMKQCGCFDYIRSLEKSKMVTKHILNTFDLEDTVVILNLPNNLKVPISIQSPTTSRVDEVRDGEEHLLLQEDGEDSLPLPVPHDLPLKDD